MRTAKWLLAAALVALTAGCVEQNGYPSTSYRHGDRNWNAAHRDSDRDGIPNRYDRDANGNGIADRYEGP